MLLPLLPPELKLSIADHLDPFSTFNFGLTNKEQWETYRPVIERHARSFAEAPVVDAVDVWKVLRDVLQDDSQARYVTELSLPANWQLQQPSTPVEDLDLLQDAARALLDIYPQLEESREETLIERIVEGVAAGWPSSIIVVLIHHLPNLKMFKMTGPSDSEEKECEVLEDFLSKVATDLGNPAKASKLPFQRLRTVALSHWDTEYCVSANQVLPFLHVPSLRTFAGHALSGYFWNSNRAKDIVYLHPRSNIEEFFFVDCQFSASAVEYMLSCTQSLKRFTYSAGGCNISASHYDAKKVLKSLSTHAWHSLEHLSLIHPSYKEQELSFRHNYVPAVTDLTMFTRLHSLCANWAMLWPDPEYMPCSGENGHRTGFDLLSTTFDIRDELPQSLKNLDLSGVFDDEEKEGLVGPLSTPNGKTPDLTVGGIRVLTPSVLADVDGWDESEVTKVFGGGDGAWVRKAWAPCSFAHIIKRY